MFKPTPSKPIPTPLPIDIEERIDKECLKFKEWLYTSDFYKDTSRDVLDGIIVEHRVAISEIASLAYNKDRHPIVEQIPRSSKLTSGVKNSF